MDRSVYNSKEKWGTYLESSVKTPNFHKLVRDGARLPVHPYFWWRVDGVSPVANTYNGPRTERDVGGNYTFKDVVTSGILQTVGTGQRLSMPTLSAERDMVSNKLLSKVRNRKVDLGVALGEHRETARFISGCITDAVSMYKALRRGRMSAAVSVLNKRGNHYWRDIPGTMANTWLGYTYGLRPLVKDVYDAVGALQTRLERPDYVTVRSGKTAIVRGAAHATGSNNYYHSAVNGYITTRGEITFYVDKPVLRTLDQCGLVNPLSVAWELVPFSFVVDWFLPVGDFFQGIVPPQGVTFVEGWISSKCRGTYRKNTTIPGWVTWSETSEVIKERILLTSFPRYHVVVPDFSLANNQIASGIALLFQASAWGKQHIPVQAPPAPGRPHWTTMWPEVPWYAR